MLEPGEIRICRACLCQITNGNFMEYERNSTKNNIYELIFCYIPEFEIEVESPCLCYECFSTLHLFHKFKKRCLRTEEDLRLYVRERPEEQVVDLFDVLIENGEEIEEVIEPSTEAMEVAPSPPPNEVPKIEPKVLSRSDDNYNCNTSDGLTFGTKVELCEPQTEAHNKTDENTLELPIKIEMDHQQTETTTTITYNEAQNNDNPPKKKVKTCTVCQNCLSTANEAELKQRLRESYTTVNNGSTCLLCKKQLKGPKTMAMHVLQSKNEGLKYKCPKCDQSFVEMTELNAHMPAVHPLPNAPDKRVCPHCTKILHASQYAYHVELHSQPNVRKFTCDLCKWVYFSRSGLDAHKQASHKM